MTPLERLADELLAGSAGRANDQEIHGRETLRARAMSRFYRERRLTRAIAGVVSERQHATNGGPSCFDAS